MKNKMPITRARSQLLKLPHILKNGDYLDVTLREEPVLRIVRLANSKETPPSLNSLLTLVEEAEQVPTPHRRPSRDLARNYKKYLYASRK